MSNLYKYKIGKNWFSFDKLLLEPQDVELFDRANWADKLKIIDIYKNLKPAENTDVVILSKKKEKDQNDKLKKEYKEKKEKLFLEKIKLNEMKKKTNDVKEIKTIDDEITKIDKKIKELEIEYADVVKIGSNNRLTVETVENLNLKNIKQVKEDLEELKKIEEEQIKKIIASLTAETENKIDASTFEQIVNAINELSNGQKDEAKKIMNEIKDVKDTQIEQQIKYLQKIIEKEDQIEKDAKDILTNITDIKNNLPIIINKLGNILSEDLKEILNKLSDDTDLDMLQEILNQVETIDTTTKEEQEGIEELKEVLTIYKKLSLATFGKQIFGEDFNPDSLDNKNVLALANIYNYYKTENIFIDQLIGLIPPGSIPENIIYLSDLLDLKFKFIQNPDVVLPINAEEMQQQTRGIKIGATKNLTNPNKNLTNYFNEIYKKIIFPNELVDEKEFIPDDTKKLINIQNYNAIKFYIGKKEDKDALPQKIILYYDPTTEITELAKLIFDIKEGGFLGIKNKNKDKKIFDELNKKISILSNEIINLKEDVKILKSKQNEPVKTKIEEDRPITKPVEEKPKPITNNKNDLFNEIKNFDKPTLRKTTPTEKSNNEDVSDLLKLMNKRRKDIEYSPDNTEDEEWANGLNEDYTDDFTTDEEPTPTPITITEPKRIERRLAGILPELKKDLEKQGLLLRKSKDGKVFYLAIYDKVEQKGKGIEEATKIKNNVNDKTKYTDLRDLYEYLY